jgi:hypothetical protein
MAAAVLVELVLYGRLEVNDHLVIATDPAAIGDPVADEVLARVAADTPHTVASWLQRLRHGLRQRVLASLCERGVVRDQDETALEHITLHRYPTVDASVEQDTRGRLTEALVGPSVPDERTAALATLVAAVRMEPTLGLRGAAVHGAHAAGGDRRGRRVRRRDGPGVDQHGHRSRSWSPSCTAPSPPRSARRGVSPPVTGSHRSRVPRRSRCAARVPMPPRAFLGACGYLPRR